MDSTICDLFAEWLGMFNADYGQNVSPDDLASWDMEHNVSIGKEMYKYLHDPHLYRRLQAFPGAIESLKRLHEAGHELHILSAHSEDEQTAADKIWWCKAHLPFISWKNVNLSHHKGRFTSDVFVDDGPHNIIDHAREQPDAFRVGIAFPYNKCVAPLMDLRAESYKDTAAAWAQIEEFINGVARGDIKR